MLADGSKRTSKDSLTPNKKIKLTQNKMINSDNNVETNDETLTESSTAQNNVDINNTTPDSKESEQIDLSQVNLFFNILDEKKVSFGVKKIVIIFNNANFMFIIKIDFFFFSDIL